MIKGTICTLRACAGFIQVFKRRYTIATFLSLSNPFHARVSWYAILCLKISRLGIGTCKSYNGPRVKFSCDILLKWLATMWIKRVLYLLHTCILKACLSRTVCQFKIFDVVPTMCAALLCLMRCSALLDLYVHLAHSPILLYMQSSICGWLTVFYVTFSGDLGTLVSYDIELPPFVIT